MFVLFLLLRTTCNVFHERQTNIFEPLLMIQRILVAWSSRANVYVGEGTKSCKTKG